MQMIYKKMIEPNLKIVFEKIAHDKEKKKFMLYITC